MVNLADTLERAVEDNLAFREIYDLTIDRVYSFVLLRTKNKSEALDICQNIYLSLWESLGKFEYRGDAHFWAFLFTIAKRQIFRSRLKTKPNVDLEQALDIPAEAEEKEDYRFLISKMGELRDKERLCLELRYFDDMKFEDIAQTLDISENNAKVLHHRALKKLKEKIETYE